VQRSPRSFGLGVQRRLRRSADFERLLRDGERRSLSGFTFFIERRDAGLPRLGMLVTRKHAAQATERNRIKRCIREAFRLEQKSLGPLDVLVRPPYGVRPAADMITRLRGLFSRLNR
jgi:ribonuclease P protein component